MNFITHRTAIERSGCRLPGVLPEVSHAVTHTSNILSQVLIIIEDVGDGRLPIPSWQHSPRPATCLHNSMECVGWSHLAVMNKGGVKPLKAELLDPEL